MRNPWPYALTAVIVAFAAAVVAFVVWSLGHRVDLVAPDYYEREIRHQEQIDREARTRNLPATYGLFHDARTGTLLIRIPGEHRDATGVLSLYRPSDAALDREIALVVDSEGKQEVRLDTLASGLWRARLTWTHGTNEYYVASTLIVE